ncbi:hydrolase [Deinococcus yavapaiensis]|uniref:Alkylation response protein AidB-like acyl-CoA dehydrogenase n=1 Tax=Deinococcus yavapaiensis KR-236 TaxID=694435 RepID=A0A318SGE5_9DEIO|nr:hydrolase [Deinococcus yavapaiensis]PYE56464.1 alkylation response protein AidB-like acyl-CoA dehydrogenase [Deinococcus yavapaiensis KR-236]
MTISTARPSLERIALDVFDVVRSHAAESEREGRLADATLAALHASGLFRSLQPQSCGGSGRPLPEVMRAIENVARADGAAGWCLLIGAGSNAFTAWMAPDVARTLLASPTTVCASIFMPSGEATSVPGGYRVSGRWSYASGIGHSTWVLATCRVPDDTPLQAFLNVEDVEIVPNWDVMGLRATGSHDFVAHDVFVPEERTLRFKAGAQDPGLLYTLPFQALLWLWFAPVPLGIARAALDALRDDVASKGVGRIGAVGHARYAEAEGLWRAARAFASDVTERAWQAACENRPLSASDVAETGVMARHVALTAAHVTRITHELAGGASLREGTLARAFRDAHAAMQHVALAPSVWEHAGRTLLEEAVKD